MSIDDTARAAIDDDRLRRLLQQVTSRIMAKRAAAIAGVPDWEALRDRARALKDEALAGLDDLLLEFERQVITRGGIVHHAADAGEACRLVAGIAADHRVQRIVKSKSMLSEEVGLNHFLEQQGFTVVETDFGEYIIQLAGERPSHIIVPAVHKSRDDVGRLFAAKLGVPYTNDPEVLAAHARRVLREEFCAADMGVSGANFALARTGTLVVVENEGNARLTTTLPRVHVALVGIEKVTRAAETLAVFLALLPRSATGQAMTSYVSLITGPRRPEERSGPRYLHVVLVDNGRRRMRRDPVMREVLTCLRCGACQNTCPVYRQIGGHSYGGVYAGPIGSLLGPGLEPRTSPPDLPFVSTLCGACAEVCPVKIAIPRVLLHLRQRAMSGATAKPLPHRRALRAGFRGWAAAMSGPRRYAIASTVMRAGLRLFARAGWVRKLPLPFDGWTDERDFPVPPKQRFLGGPATSGDGPGDRDDHRDRHRPGAEAPGATTGGVAAAAPVGQAFRPAGAGDLLPPSRDALIARFKEAAEAVQAVVSIVPDMAAARDRVSEILASLPLVTQGEPRSRGVDVLVSEDAWQAPWDLRAHTAAGPMTMRSMNAIPADQGLAAAKSASVGITAAAYGMADTGTVVVCSGPAGGRVESLLPPLHIALLRADDLLPGLAELLPALAADCRFERSSAVTFITGPSRTADIELTLTIGVHGPKQLFVIVARRLPGPEA
jgi:L-lactate dehydrogenase complex protein LldF